MDYKVLNSHKRKQVQADPEILPKVLQVVELIVKTKNKRAPRDIYSITFQTCDKIRSKSLGREYVELITGCISNHRYKEAVALLSMIYRNKSIPHVFIFKAAMIIFNNLEFDNKSYYMRLFKGSFARSRQVNKQEIMLEYLLYCFKNDTQIIDSVFQDSSILLKKRTLRKDDKIDPILEAYTALLHYITWCKLYIGNPYSTTNEASREKALFAFGKLFQKPGQWDIFILKAVEMMESSDVSNEIENLLLKYVNTNPHDINGYIYLCVYLFHNNPESENFVKYLEILTDMCPSDPRILWLFEIWNKQGKELKNSLKHIFMFLDYPANGKNILAWKLLLKNLYLAILKSDEKEFKVIKRLWKSRSGSWKWMYFNPSKLTKLDTCDSLLIAHRVVVISIFDSEHIFIKEMMENFPGVANLVNSLKEEMQFSEKHSVC